MYYKTALYSLLFVSTLAGCATHQGATSFVSGISQDEASKISNFIADILANSMDASQSTLQLLPYEGRDTVKAQEFLRNSLREKGFALSPDGMPYPGAHTLSYTVTPFKVEGYNSLLELHVDDSVATCPYSRNKEGELHRAGGCTVREGDQLSLNPPPSSVVDTTSNVLTPLISDLDAPIASSWNLVEGVSARQQIIRWGHQIGWRVIWLAPDWVIPQNTTLTGEFFNKNFNDKDDGNNVIAQFIHAVNAQGMTLTAEFYPSNHVLVIKKEE